MCFRLELTDADFDFSVLSAFRQRLLEAGLEEELLNRLLQVCRERGWRKRAWQATRLSPPMCWLPSAASIDAECVAATRRPALNSLAVVVPAWLRSQVPAAWYVRYATRTEAYRFPKEASKRQALTEQIGADGWWRLRAIRSADAPSWVAQVPAVEVTLARVGPTILAG